jgi:holo-[acyl-carrier protein] synthase
MFRGVGIDLFDTHRLERELALDGAGLLRSLFTPDEVAACVYGRASVARLAACFAGKEAVAKALSFDGSLGLPWRRIEVLERAPGAAEVRLHGALAERARALGVARIRVSLGRRGARILAVAVAES